MKACTQVLNTYDKWQTFLSHHVEGEPASSSVGQIARDAYTLIINDETRANLSFIVAFGKAYWSSGYNWIRRHDTLSKRDGHSCHECLIQVFCMMTRLKKIQTNWQQDCAFAACQTLTDALSNEVKENQVKSPKDSTINRYNVFFKKYIEAFRKGSGFGRWMSSLASFTLGLSNTKAVHIFSKYVEACR